MPKTFTSILIIIFLFPALQGCVTVKQKPESIYYGLERKYASFDPDNFQKEIRRLKLIVYNESKLDKHGKAYLGLAFIHLAHNNPERDYAKAGKAIEQYVAIEPRAAKIHNLQNWMIALKKIEEIESKKSKKSLPPKLPVQKNSLKKLPVKKKREVKRLKGENRKLSHEIQALENMVKKLRGDIEKLSELDLELEKKRKINR